MFETVNPKVRFPELEESVLDFWREHRIFEASLARRAGAPEFIFYEGPPTANGNPGIHHVQARAYKDLFPRYKTMRGYLVHRKAGWDCHGLPVEIEVEKRLGFSGKRAIEAFGIEAFNRRCRESVMEYEGAWRKLTERIGFWVDMDSAYLTMSRDYIESVWWSLRQLWDKGLLYLGHKVVPYCARCGTPLSTAEVGLGYKEVEDPSVYLRFPLQDPQALGLPEGASLLVWTTTPWTLPGNTAAAVHPGLTYLALRHQGEVLVVAEARVEALFPGEVEEGEVEILARFDGPALEGARYRAPYPLFDFGDRVGHRVVCGEFVTAEDGTGIVHIAPAFGADDLEMSRRHGLPVIHSVNPEGRFVNEVGLVAGMWFKEGDPVILEDLSRSGLLFRLEGYRHPYPHCWRCSNPLLYFATDSWFIRNTRLKERLQEKNRELDWHPPHIQTGRYGDWLQNLVDWALSRSRYWGTPLPIWRCEGCDHQECVGSFEELAARSDRPLDVLSPGFDPHRPYVDDVHFSCPSCGGRMTRVSDVIDCWYDSGAMPFAQLHYPFENRERFERSFPADFICEGLDQTRGWFNSLHQLGVLLFDSVAYRTVICHGLVLDGEGEKMSKSRGNVVNPWEVIASQGADAIRWYLYTSAPPEANRRFSVDLVGEAARHLGTWWNTYVFFLLNAKAARPQLTSDRPWAERDLFDRAILARLNQTVAEVTESLEGFDPTRAARALERFCEELSNWYVRRSRRRFWDNDLQAFQTLYEVLTTLARLQAPFTPFLAEVIWRGLVPPLDPEAPVSVHLADWPMVDPEREDSGLIQASAAARQAASVGLAVRNAARLRVRLPLSEAVIRPRSEAERAGLERFAGHVQEELNVKRLRFLEADESLSYQLLPNLALVGRKHGARVPALRRALEAADGPEVARRVRQGEPVSLTVEGEEIQLLPEEILVKPGVPAGYEAQEEGGLFVALVTTLTDELRLEGTARDLVRHIQEARKEAGFELGERIGLSLDGVPPEVLRALEVHRETILSETLADSLAVGPAPAGASRVSARLDKEGQPFGLAVWRLNPKDP